jgi:hypothetical protein
VAHIGHKEEAPVKKAAGGVQLHMGDKPGPDQMDDEFVSY